MLKNVNVVLLKVLTCVYIVITVIGYVHTMLESIVSRKSKRTGYLICFILLCIFVYYMSLICDTFNKLINFQIII